MSDTVPRGALSLLVSQLVIGPAHLLEPAWPPAVAHLISNASQVLNICAGPHPLKYRCVLFLFQGKRVTKDGLFRIGYGVAGEQGLPAAPTCL